MAALWSFLWTITFDPIYFLGCCKHIYIHTYTQAKTIRLMSSLFLRQRDSTDFLFSLCFWVGCFQDVKNHRLTEARRTELYSPGRTAWLQLMNGNADLTTVKTQFLYRTYKFRVYRQVLRWRQAIYTDSSDITSKQRDTAYSWCWSKAQAKKCVDTIRVDPEFKQKRINTAGIDFMFK